MGGKCSLPTKQIPKSQWSDTVKPHFSLTQSQPPGTGGQTEGTRGDGPSALPGLPRRPVASAHSPWASCQGAEALFAEPLCLRQSGQSHDLFCSGPSQDLVGSDCCDLDGGALPSCHWPAAPQPSAGSSFLKGSKQLLTL